MSGNQGKNSAENGKKGGRPKSSATIRTQLFREALSKRIEQKADEYLDAIEHLALGHYVETESTDGTKRIYQKSPSVKAWKEIMDRAHGKVAVSIEARFDDDDRIQNALDGIQQLMQRPE